MRRPHQPQQENTKIKTTVQEAVQPAIQKAVGMQEADSLLGKITNHVQTIFTQVSEGQQVDVDIDQLLANIADEFSAFDYGHLRRILLS